MGLAAVTFFLVPVHAVADSVLLSSGERVIGQIVAEEPDRVVMVSPTLGRFEIQRKLIERIERDESEAPTEAAPVLPDSPEPAANDHASTPASGLSGVLTNGFYPWLGEQGDAQKKFDWIQLNSGEWLKGELKSLQDRELEFDSDKMDLQDFDWDDVYQVYSPGLNEALFEGKETFTGPIYITRDKVFVDVGDVGDAPRVFDRGSLVAVTPGGPREINYWSGKLAAGMTFRSGNTEQTEFNVTASLRRRTPATRLSVDYIGNFTKIDGEKSADNDRVSGQFDVWLSRRMYLKTPFAEYFRDPFQNLAHRVTAGVGMGYQLIEDPKLKWEMSAGPAYQHTWFDSVRAGESSTEENLAGVFSTLIDAEISKRVDFKSNYQLIYTKESAGGYTHHWQNTFEIELTKTLDLDVTFSWDRVSHPATSSDGTTPKPDDFRSILTLGVNF